MRSGRLNSDFARAYHAQSQSDFKVFEFLLAEPSVPVCHPLHYLQMASEKIAKAYALAWEPDRSVDEIHRHNLTTPFVRQFTQRPNVTRHSGKERKSWVANRNKVAQVAREVEKLAPAVDDTRSPQNAEYPWEAGGVVRWPAAHDFPELGLRSMEMLRFLGLIRAAIDEFGVET